MDKQKVELDSFMMIVSDYAKKFKYMDDQELVRNSVSRYLFDSEYKFLDESAKKKIDKVISDYKIPIVKSKNNPLYKFMIKRLDKNIGFIRK